VKGVQESGVGACVKHFVANESETSRKSYDVAESADGRAMREIYMRAFECMLRDSNPASMMMVYNKLMERAAVRIGSSAMYSETSGNMTVRSCLIGMALILEQNPSPLAWTLKCQVPVSTVALSLCRLYAQALSRTRTSIDLYSLCFN
jgi:hypothetical protein